MSREHGQVISAVTLRQANPRIIARNHLVEQVLQTASDQGDLHPFDSLLQALRRPFDDDEGLAAYAEPAPPEVAAQHQTFCGT